MYLPVWKYTTQIVNFQHNLFEASHNYKFIPEVLIPSKGIESQRNGMRLPKRTAHVAAASLSEAAGKHGISPKNNKNGPKGFCVFLFWLYSLTGFVQICAM